MELVVGNLAGAREAIPAAGRLSMKGSLRGKVPGRLWIDLRTLTRGRVQHACYEPLLVSRI